MSVTIADKLVAAAQNEKKVYKAGYDKGYDEGYALGKEEGGSSAGSESGSGYLILTLLTSLAL